MQDRPAHTTFAAQTTDSTRPGARRAGLGAYPHVRMRRNRKSAWSRALVAETSLSASDFIWPLFVMAGTGIAEPVESMPGVDRMTVDLIPSAAEKALALGIPAIAIFPYTQRDLRDEHASQATNPDNLVCRAVRAVRAASLDIGIVCDAALDPYTSHGHDGFLRDGIILNDETIEALIAQSLIQVEAGCDVIAPSDMMDGRVGQIRAALESSGHTNVQIMSYAAKYASGFYAPFRDAIGSSGTLKGDKRTYQMDPRNTDEALREVALDLEEGADLVMVKPGMPYLDIIQRVSSTFSVPTVAYQVSGEYAMLKAAAEADMLDGDRVMLESLQAFKRAGACAILTYFAPAAARLLNEQSG
ncbi:MAG: porphobilinogen synthase [Pseudomonadota bacterium]